MKNTRHTSVALLALVLAASSFSLVTVSPAYACGANPCPPPDPVPEPTKGNNGFGQEKHGALQDGENPGSDQGTGVPSGGPGAGLAGLVSKQNGTGLR